QVLCHPVTDKLGFTGCYSLCIFYIIYYSLHSNNCSRISGFLLAGSNKIFLAFSLAPVLCHFISCVYVAAVGLCVCVCVCVCVCGVVGRSVCVCVVVVVVVVCVCVRVYICTLVCVYVCMYVCMCIYMCKCVLLHVCM